MPLPRWGHCYSSTPQRSSLISWHSWVWHGTGNGHFKLGHSVKPVGQRHRAGQCQSQSKDHLSSRAELSPLALNMKTKMVRVTRTMSAMRVMPTGSPKRVVRTKSSSEALAFSDFLLRADSAACRPYIHTCPWALSNFEFCC